MRTKSTYQFEEEICLDENVGRFLFVGAASGQFVRIGGKDAAREMRFSAALQSTP